MKKLNSIFTDDTDVCYYTQTPYPDHHHVFNKYDKKRSERLGYVIPLHPKLHPNGVNVDDNAIRLYTDFNNRWELDEWLRQECQRHYEKTHSREEFLKEFGRSWL